MSCLLMTAQATRAVLLANATATTSRGFRLSKDVNQRSVLACFEHSSTVWAPLTSSHRTESAQFVGTFARPDPADDRREVVLSLAAGRPVRKRADSQSRHADRGRQASRACLQPGEVGFTEHETTTQGVSSTRHSQPRPRFETAMSNIKRLRLI